MTKNRTLIVITGPTGIGKTSVAISVAKKLGTEIISADSRQIYREIPIGTAAPTASELAEVPHHFVAFKNLDEYYSAAQFEDDALKKITDLHDAGHEYVVMCGGSMMYVDAVCNGIDALPTISAEVRENYQQRFAEEGLAPMLEELQRVDPVYYEEVDRQNAKRVVHALEICAQAGVPYSTLRTGEKKPRPFNVLKVALTMPRAELFERINHRVDAMMEQGLEAEARRVFPLRHLNSLNTVGYKEMFAYFDGAMDYVTARERIKKNTRVYAKKQLTWYAKDADVQWMHPAEAAERILQLLNEEK